MGQGSWPTHTAVKANDRWREALLAAACYLVVEPFQGSKTKSKPSVFFIFFHFMKQYLPNRAVCMGAIPNKCTKRWTEPYMMVFYEVGEAVPLVTSSFYRIHPHVNAEVLPLACDRRPHRLCFPSRAITGQHACEGHQCQGQCLGLCNCEQKKSPPSVEVLECDEVNLVRGSKS